MFGGSRDQAEAPGNIYRGMCILPAWILLFKKKSKEKEKSTKDICNVKVFIYHERRLDYV